MPAALREGPGSVASQSMLDLWCRKWHCDGFVPTIRFLPCQHQFHTCCCYQKDKRNKSGNLTKSNALSEIGGRLIEKCFHFSCTRLTKMALSVGHVSYVTYQTVSFPLAQSKQHFRV
jgi:hypothetical protein